MNDDIITYFESRGHHIHKLVERRPPRLREDKIMLAISDVYDQILKGRDIPDIQLAREVWRKASDYSNSEMHRRMDWIRQGNAELKKKRKLLKLGIGACAIAFIVMVVLIILQF